jgi:hypothetical protein
LVLTNEYNVFQLSLDLPIQESNSPIRGDSTIPNS